MSREEKKKVYSTGIFSWVLQNISEHLFWRIPADGCYDDKVVLWQSFALVRLLPLRFKLILLVILKLLILWNVFMILRTFDSSLFSNFWPTTCIRIRWVRQHLIRQKTNKRQNLNQNIDRINCFLLFKI